MPQKADDVISFKIAGERYEIFMFRSYTHTYENDITVLCFEVETYVYSAAELERYFHST